MKRTFNFLLLNKKLFKALFIGFLIFTFLKVLFIIRFGNFSTFKNYSTDIPHMIFNSVRFDIQSLTYIFVIFFLVNSFSLIFNSDKFIQFINAFSINLIPIFLIISILLLIADQEFYSFFKFHFNTVTFDFFNENPKLLIKSIWQEHPIIKILFISLILFFIIKFIINKVYTNTMLRIDKFHLTLRIFISALVIGLYILLMRGSIGTFPLQKEDITVSECKFINACVTNGLFSLKEAYVESKSEYIIDQPVEVLNRYGFNSINEAITVYKGFNIDSLKSSNYEDYIFSSTGIKKSDKKYNLVFFIMESMSNHFINFHNENYNLLGSLETHFKEDVVFRNFQSSNNNTICTLEDIILNCPFHSIFNNRYRYIPFEISIAKPFKDAGYKTCFITGLELGWRHLDEVLNIQYFDHVYGKSGILRNDPEAKSNDTWGVFDHHVFNYIFDLLSESDTAMFILSLSSTNHTPYELPKDYKPYPIDPSISNKPEFSVDPKRCLEVLTAFQYSNDALGLFLNKLKSSPLAENTIVIITGDHNIRSIISYNTQEMMPLKFSVPFYLYVPDDLKKKLHIDPERWASHYDIMTSIYPYILNDVNYLNLGQNLFQKNTSNDQYYSLNDVQLLCSETANKKEIEKKVNARTAIINYYYSTKIHGK